MTATTVFKAEADAFGVLADPHRLAIIDTLAAGQKCVKEIKDEMPGVQDSKMSYHLGRLQSAGIIQGAHRGNHIDYAIAPIGERVRCVIGDISALLADAAVEDS